MATHTTAQQTVIAALATKGIESCSGKGGIFVRGQGWMTTKKAAKLAGVVLESKPRAPKMEISAYGDWAWVAKINRVR